MALSGDHVIVKMDDSGGTLRQFADGDIRSIDLGQQYDQFDVTGFGDEAHQFINGQLQAPVTIEGYLTTESPGGTHTVIQGAFAAGSQVTLEVQGGGQRGARRERPQVQRGVSDRELPAADHDGRGGAVHGDLETGDRRCARMGHGVGWRFGVKPMGMRSGL